MHHELVAFSATQPNTGAAAAALTGDSLTIKNSRGKSPRIVQWWADQQVAGWQQLVFPTGHDTTRGLRVGVVASEVDFRLPLGMPVEVQPQELLSVTIAGSNTAGDVEQGCFMVHYPDLPGVTQRLMTFDQVRSRTKSLVTVNLTIAATAGPAWTGAELITAESDLLRANQDYAVLGISVETECLAVALRGPDTGYVRIGVPGNDTDDPYFGPNFFGLLSRAYDLPFIPVINSGNKASTYLEAAQDENGTDVACTIHLAQL